MKQYNIEVVSTTANVLWGGVQVNGQSNTIEEFVDRLRLDMEWLPYGYNHIVIYRPLESKNITAFLYRTKTTDLCTTMPL